ncbi:hypothetical protein ACFQ3R_14780, partial [Mesonia ostreae]|uniref:hypothetical protein n=1 Tax=Mesonia ostreae TaxID=861110 RepID=UPI00363E11BE
QLRKVVQGFIGEDILKDCRSSSTPNDKLGTRKTAQSNQTRMEQIAQRVIIKYVDQNYYLF